MSTTPDTTPAPVRMDPAEANRHMRKHIDEALNLAAGQGAYATRVVADHLVTALRQADPDLLLAWLDAHAVDLVHDTMSYLERSSRAHARAISNRSAFARALDTSLLTGDRQGALLPWLSSVFDVEGVKKRLATMDRTDCITAAEAYGGRARRNAMQEAMLRAIARTLEEGQTVGQRWSEAELAGLWRSAGVDID